LEFAIDKKKEVSKLPTSDFPVTAGVNECGQAITLKKGVHECEASIHRSEEGKVWIYSARVRLNDPNQTDLYANFLQTSGIEVGTDDKSIYVDLEFTSRNIVNVSI
jgi:hypothetical protein